MKHSFGEQVNAIKIMRDRLIRPVQAEPKPTEYNPLYLHEVLNDAASTIAALNLTKDIPKDEDSFYLYLLQEIVGYEKLRDGWKSESKEHAAYQLIVRQLQRVKAEYVKHTPYKAVKI